jgi:hypothetical protein
MEGDIAAVTAICTSPGKRAASHRNRLLCEYCAAEEILPSDRGIQIETGQ